MKTVRENRLEHTIEKLRAEANEAAVNKAIADYKNATNEMNKMREKYNALFAELRTLKETYTGEMNTLMKRIRAGK